MNLTVAIIGAGGTGSAAARFLAREGHSVTVFEQFTLDHDRGSSFGSSRIIRRTYPEALYTRLMGEAYPLWEELEREAGEELFVRCGGLTFGREVSPVMARTEEALRVGGVPYERLTAAQVSERYPPLRLDPDEYAVRQADSGFLRASRCVRAQMRLARDAGAVLRENCPVRAVGMSDRGRPTVAWDEENEEFDRVLVTAGPWMAKLLPMLALPLTVTRQYYAHFQVQGAAERFAADAFPVWIDADANFYGFPLDREVPGVKVAWHAHGEATDPNAVRRQTYERDRRPLEQYVARRLPNLHGSPLREKTCLYTNTPDEDFLLDAVPDMPGVFFCSGCSGHGFKFTILLGQILTKLAEEKPVAADWEWFRLSRLGRSQGAAGA